MRRNDTHRNFAGRTHRRTDKLLKNVWATARTRRRTWCAILIYIPNTPRYCTWTTIDTNNEHAGALYTHDPAMIRSYILNHFEWTVLPEDVIGHVHFQKSIGIFTIVKNNIEYWKCQDNDRTIRDQNWWTYMIEKILEIFQMPWNNRKRIPDTLHRKTFTQWPPRSGTIATYTLS